MTAIFKAKSQFNTKLVVSRHTEMSKRYEFCVVCRTVSWENPKIVENNTVGPLGSNEIYIHCRTQSKNSNTKIFKKLKSATSNVYKININSRMSEMTLSLENIFLKRHIDNVFVGSGKVNNSSLS